MTPSEVVNTIGMIAALAFSVYATFRKRRQEDRREDIGIDGEESEAKRREDEAVSTQWKAYAKSREAIHAADIQRVELRLATNERELADLRTKERECHGRSEALEARNQIMQRRLEELERYAGIETGSKHHKPLEGGEDGSND